MPSSEARRLVDVLMHHVLKTCVTDEASERLLTRARLYEVIDRATRISVSRADLDELIRVASSIGSAPDPGGPTGAMFLTTGDGGWLVSHTELPSPRLLIPRPEVETTVDAAIFNSGFAVLVGGTGVGKSLLARTSAQRIGAPFVIADLWEATAEETYRRLNALLGRMDDQTGLILEHLNHAEDPRVQVALARVFASLTRRDGFGIVTCYRQPSVKTTSILGIDHDAVVEVPHFTREEASAIVQASGGDPAKWGHLAYAAGGLGHSTPLVRVPATAFPRA